MLALALACLGIYGLMSYAVKQRTAELGLRFALGAPPPRVLWMVFRESLMLMIADSSLGLPMVGRASRLLGHAVVRGQPERSGRRRHRAGVLLAVGARPAICRRGAHRASIR